MKVFTTDKIRNVVVLGHSGAGKTSLVSAMNGIATASKQRMTEPAATTQMLVQPILWDDHKINILDVPEITMMAASATPTASSISPTKSNAPGTSRMLIL